MTTAVDAGRALEVLRAVRDTGPAALPAVLAAALHPDRLATLPAASDAEIAAAVDTAVVAVFGPPDTPGEDTSVTQPQPVHADPLAVDGAELAPVDFDTTKARPAPERLTLFTVDGTSYGVQNPLPAGLVLRMLDVMGSRGEGALVAELIPAALGPDGYHALLHAADEAGDDAGINQIINRIRKLFYNRLKDVAGNS